MILFLRVAGLFRFLGPLGEGVQASDLRWGASKKPACPAFMASPKVGFIAASTESIDGFTNRPTTRQTVSLTRPTATGNRFVADQRLQL
jgi:hypothetical protein